MLPKCLDFERLPLSEVSPQITILMTFYCNPDSQVPSFRACSRAARLRYCPGYSGLLIPDIPDRRENVITYGLSNTVESNKRFTITTLTTVKRWICLPVRLHCCIILQDGWFNFYQYLEYALILTTRYPSACKRIESVG